MRQNLNLLTRKRRGSGMNGGIPAHYRSRRALYGIVVCLVLVLLLIAASVISLSLGSVHIPWHHTALVLLGMEDEAARMIVVQLRLPRVLIAVMVGLALGVSGTLLQGVFRNALASPELMGVTGGGSVAAVSFMTLMNHEFSIHFLPLVATIGAFAAAILIYLLAWRQGVSPFRLILIGIGVSSAMSALTTFLLISGPSYLASQVLGWLTGTLYGSSLEHVSALLPWMAVFIPLSWLLASRIDVLSLGDATARGLGARVEATRLIVLFCSVALAGTAVGIAGGISFVGLMAPHIGRRLVGPQHRWLILASGLIGAILLVGADLVGRMLWLPKDLPAGIFTAALGAPFFFYLLYRQK